MKVYKVDAHMRTLDNIDFLLDYFVFVKRETTTDGKYTYVMRNSDNSTNAFEINQAKPFVVTLDSDNWKDAVAVQFDTSVRAINPNVDKLMIEEIIL